MLLNIRDMHKIFRMLKVALNNIRGYSKYPYTENVTHGHCMDCVSYKKIVYNTQWYSSEKKDVQPNMAKSQTYNKIKNRCT